MKINTITCHDVYNSGASLQAYALMKYLQGFGHDVKIIDYKPEYLSRHYKLWIVANPKYEKNMILKIIYLLLKLPGRLWALKTKKVFDNFKNQYLDITETRYKSNEELKENLPEADIYIAGSDQIWNATFPNGKDEAFYLDFVPNNKIKASYAASFATETFPEELKQKTSKMLSQFDYISVREKSGLDILKNMDINNGVQVLDPVFLLNKDHWDKMCIDINCTGKYLLVYDFDNNPLIKEIAIKISKEKGLKIYTIFKSDYSDKVISQMGPIEFISYIKNAEFIISNSFHGTAYSLIFEKEFIVTNRVDKINTRMRDLLSEIGISERLVSNIDEINCLEKLNYSDIKYNIDKLIKQSKLYLDKVIGEYNEEKDIICN